MYKNFIPSEVVAYHLLAPPDRSLQPALCLLLPYSSLRRYVCRNEGYCNNFEQVNLKYAGGEPLLIFSLVLKLRYYVSYSAVMILLFYSLTSRRTVCVTRAGAGGGTSSDWENAEA